MTQIDSAYFQTFKSTGPSISPQIIVLKTLMIQNSIMLSWSIKVYYITSFYDWLINFN